MSCFVHCWQKHKKKHKEHGESVDKTPPTSELATEVNLSYVYVHIILGGQKCSEIFWDISARSWTKTSNLLLC